MCHINTIVSAILICILAIFSVPKYAQTIIQSDLFTTIQIYTLVDKNNSQYPLLVDVVNNFTRYGEFEMYFRGKNTSYSFLRRKSTSNLVSFANSFANSAKKFNDSLVYFVEIRKVKKI
uniref:Uncharacterized protein n=1 Tax=viral metagenome TaxID=1070528 RepID=A0A6C0C7C6_9ZZZZ